MKKRTYEALEEQLGSLLACLATLLIFLLFAALEFDFEKVYILTTITSILLYYFFTKNCKTRASKKMNLYKFCVAMFIGRCISVFVSVFVVIGVLPKTNAGTAESVGLRVIDMVIVVAFGPILEELLFRGTYLSKARNSSVKTKWAIIVITSILFGIAHIDLRQSIDAGLKGVIWGYVAIHYGIIWSILMHMFNNLMPYIAYWAGDTRVVWTVVLVIIIFLRLHNQNT